MDVLFVARVDDGRTWFWRYGYIFDTVFALRGFSLSTMYGLSKVLRGLGIRYWLWLGGVKDKVVESSVNEVLIRDLSTLDFEGVIGPDITVLVNDPSVSNYARFYRYLWLIDELRRLCRAFRIKFIPQIKYVHLNDLDVVLNRLGSDEAFYNASFELSDGVNIEPIVNLLRSRFKLWLGVTGWLRDLELVSRLKPHKLIVWRHTIRLHYPRRGRDPKDELLRLINDLRIYGLI
ncbi:MAG: hypothetical protein DRI01_08960 [Chloroflexi bacterium]|nr:MAG: hypothetical protein DRI01_08960 [Chloroflexota bacterium]